MRFSLVVTTLGRYDDLIILFKSLMAQTFQDYELLLVDQNGDDTLAPLIAQYGDACNIRHLHTRAPGLCLGRNTGIHNARGDIVTLTDDDCEFPHEFLGKIDQLFTQRPELDGLTTNTHAKERSMPLGQWDSDAMRLNKLTVMDRCAEFTTFLRRAAVGSERYDEQWGLGARTPWWADEGPDFLIRLMERGLRIWFFPNLIVYHPEKNRAINRSILKRSYHYSRGRGHFYRMHRFPVRIVANSLIRSLGGTVISAAKLDAKRAAYYGCSLAGKVRGLLDARHARGQSAATTL